jgi:tRNA (guanine37-N1)-methyltransferase
MKFDIITIFPDIINAYLKEGVIGRAITKKKVLEVNVHNLRDFADNPHHKVDDTPFGGGAGMIMTIDPFYKALEQIIETNPTTSKLILFTKAGGEVFTQQTATQWAQDFDHIIILCGRYEGIDARVEKYLCHKSVSIGKFVLSGGELASLVIMDSVARLIPEVLGNEISLHEESYTEVNQLEYPQFTKPRAYTPTKPDLVNPESPASWEVPEILFSGNHQEIDNWKKSNFNKK